MNTTDRFDRRLLRAILPIALLASAAVTGCSDDLTDPGAQVSDSARASAATRTGEVLATDQMLQTAQTVDDLTGGFDVGLADETAGLDMELGDDVTVPPAGAAAMSASAAFVRAERTLRASARELQIRQESLAKAAAAAPGDLLFSFTESNLDGSESLIEVYQDEPEAVVRVVRTTTWPGGHLILDRIIDEIVVDRGADFLSDADDVWLSLDSIVRLIGGAELERSVDARADGGLQDDMRIDVVSSFRPAPGHPRLIDVVSNLVIDVHLLADETDDRFVSIDRTTTLTGTAHDGGSPRVIEMLQPETPIAEGEEPCGGSLSREIHFRNDRALQSWTDSASWACAGGGSLSRTVVYADGSEDSVSITEDAQGIVTLEASNHDGTIVSGTFDPAQNSFEFTTVYPEGSDPVSRAVQGSTNADETAWQLDEQVTFLDGFVETNHLEGSEDDSGKQLAGTHNGRDESVSFELHSNADETRLEGWIENDQQERLEWSVEILPDDSKIIDFTATEPGVQVVGHFEEDPDGCGEGTLEITENGATATIDVSYCDGELDDSLLLGAN